MPDSTKFKRFHAVVFGRVQGVGFRNATQTTALGLDITGWVRNRLNGTVEVQAEGTQDQLERFLEWLRVGPLGARVDRVEVNWSESEPEKRSEAFDILIDAP